jgi:glucan phosphoethanolaminetransferase (alkaline phosphatase superfamily)
MGNKRRVLVPAGLWVLSAAVGTVVAWWRDSSLAYLQWAVPLKLTTPGKCVRESFFERIANDALRLFNASTLWLMVGTWVLTLILACITGWIARSSTSRRSALRLVATCFALYALVAATGLALTYWYGTWADPMFYASATYSELLLGAAILLIAPSAVLFFAAWLVRGFVIKRSARMDNDSAPPDSLPTDLAT